MAGKVLHILYLKACAATLSSPLRSLRRERRREDLNARACAWVRTRPLDPSRTRVRYLPARLLFVSWPIAFKFTNAMLAVQASGKRGRKEGGNERKRRNKKGTLWKYTGRGRSILFVSGCSRCDSKPKRTPLFSWRRRKKERERERSWRLFSTRIASKSFENRRRGCYRVGWEEREESLWDPRM